MSISWKVPRQSRFISTANIFAAQFNVPTVGRYDFGIAANAGVAILLLQPNTVYLVERITVSGDISDTDYAGALDLAAAGNMPIISLRRSLDNSSVYQTALPLPGYVPQQESAVWLKSDRLDDTLTGTVTGLLVQTPGLVGRAFVRLTVAFSIYAIESTVFNRAFRDQEAMPDLGRRVRGAGEWPVR